jgi:hypothetical protein
MKRVSFVASVIAVGFAAISFAQDNAAAETSANAQYRSSDMHRLAREAHTPAQYSVLAAFHRQQQESYRKQAADEKIEWERRSLNVTGPLAKSPRPVDSARNLYEYYAERANAEASLATHYQQLEQSSRLASGN